MRLDDNKEASAMVERALNSLEGKFREAYNKGYKDGLKDGAAQIVQKMVDDLVEEAESCDSCRWNTEEWSMEHCDGCSKAYSNYEPKEGSEDNAKR